MIKKKKKELNDIIAEMSNKKQKLIDDITHCTKKSENLAEQAELKESFRLLIPGVRSRWSRGFLGQRSRSLKFPKLFF